MTQVKKPRRVLIHYDPEAEIGWPSGAAVEQRSTKKATPRRASHRPLPQAAAHLDKTKCQEAAGLRFSPAAVATLNDLADYCELYADSGSEGRSSPLFMMADFRSPSRHDRAALLAALVEGVTEVWRASGGTKRERLTRLMRSLFEQRGLRPPPASTLRRAVRAAYNCRRYS
jgi:hypothetical protein